MSETLTDEHHDWVTNVLQVDPRSYPAPAASKGDDSGGDDSGGLLGSIGKGLSDLKDKVIEGASQLKDKVVQEATDLGEAAEKKATELKQAVVDTAKHVERVVEDGVSEAGKTIKEAFTGPAPVKRGEIGPVQKERSDKLLDEMSEDDRKKVEKALDDAGPEQRVYLRKAIASKHSAKDIEDFQKQIAGKDQKWLDENLHLVGETSGSGIKQQWHDSCAPTSTQAMRGELDPIFALKLRTDNPNFGDVDEHDATAKNPKMAEDQRKMLVDKGGIAVNRKAAGGKGASYGAVLNGQTAQTGMKFETTSLTDDNIDTALGDTDKALDGGLPVPMRVGDGGTDGHAVLIVSRDPGPPRTYAVHDPWDGKIVQVTDKQIKDGSFNIAGWSKPTHLYKPEPE